MSKTLRIILILISIFFFFFCIRRIKQSKLKISNTILWLFGSVVLVFMAVFLNKIGWIANKLGFMATVNFVFFIIIGFLLVQVFIDNLRICSLNEKVKELSHYIALSNQNSEKKG